MRRYRVIGPRPVFEHEPGSEFERDLREGEEAALLGVHLQIVEPEPDPAPVPVEQSRTRGPNSEPESEEVNDA